jgi:hypothetical protein
VAVLLAFATPAIGGLPVLVAAAAGHTAAAWFGFDQAVSFTRQILATGLWVLPGAFVYGALPSLLSGI